MSGIEFDREAIGVNAKKDWADASYFGAIGSGLDSIAVDHPPIAAPLERGDNVPVEALQKRAEEFMRVMQNIALEFSDACAVLGSGQEEAIGEMDATERQSDEVFRSILERMEER